MKKQMTFSKRAEDVTCQFEGCKLDAYYDVDGVLTIGYGHTASVYPSQRISTEQALAMLQGDLGMAAAHVRTLVTREDLSQGEFDALTDFVFNEGYGHFATSTLLRCVNAGDFDAAAKEFLRWDRGNGVVLSGLLRRRETEQGLFAGVPLG